MSEIVQTLPNMQVDYVVSPEQVADFQRNGHILLKGIASAEEIAAYRPHIQQAVKELNVQSKPLSQRDTYGKAFIQVSNIWETHESVKKFVLAARFAKVAANLLGVENVRIYHDQALFKEPGGGHTPWHQDQIYWPLDTKDTVTLWMPLVDISEEVGSMTFVSGSHHKGYISKLEISDESHKNLAEYIEHHQLPQVSHGAMKAGDATFHYGWTLHSAPGNPTDQMREVMTIIYFADGARVLEPDSNARKNDLRRWLPGLKPGDKAASRLNPLV
ncbi:phytanoyl-CoA dioxygenase family protein [Alicyclobacillus fodiniaquatilis]|jgi:ectoine hydroxylase-related dioxygenase (phytanoyl-CoA dioxygenase family)|uniref:Phytanoyl-CoA dioxygenase family protein n=1 Tax=Alicyclobacillus fodiniaquatilis TaxID=1661150 RepID=A0ABW4JDQ2_9BACL